MNLRPGTHDARLKTLIQCDSILNSRKESAKCAMRVFAKLRRVVNVAEHVVHQCKKNGVARKVALRFGALSECRGGRQKKGGAGAAKMTDVSHCHDNIPGVSWLMHARGRKGRGRCELGAGGSTRDPEKAAARGGKNNGNARWWLLSELLRHGVATTGLFLSTILPRGKVGHDATRKASKGHIIRSGLDADWTEVGIERRHLALLIVFRMLHFHFSVRLGNNIF